MDMNGKVILSTGGTGSFGKRVVEKILIFQLSFKK
jgi:FlaA1/EpsC-like NDP-sugar epimerase